MTRAQSSKQAAPPHNVRMCSRGHSHYCQRKVTLPFLASLEVKSGKVCVEVFFCVAIHHGRRRAKFTLVEGLTHKSHGCDKRSGGYAGTVTTVQALQGHSQARALCLLGSCRAAFAHVGMQDAEATTSTIYILYIYIYMFAKYA